MEQKKVLIIEDEKPVQELISRLVENHNAAVTVAGSGQEADDILKNNKVRYDLVILDLILPEITGWDILETIKSSPLNKETPIIIFTGANLSEKEKEKMLLKANAIFEKNTFTYKNFNKILEQWL
jgi:CheY-like chemotaxis protein